jgi:NAD-dependent dihydropyrimidine dehydrogenase PreA subunit
MLKRIVYCNCQGEIVSPEIKESISRSLKNLKIDTFRFSDLCGLCVSNKSAVKQVISSSEQTLIAACHPRAIKKLLEYAGVEKTSNLIFLNLRETSEEEILSTLNSFCEEGLSSQTDLFSECAWPSWYPVIDYNRCSVCGQCSDFCLFGVYEKIDGAVKVINPKGCKNNCPACARICPETAIIFPKYKHGGAISGTDSIDEVAEHQRQGQDLKTILGSDIYKALEMRKAKRQSIIKDEAMKKAIEERDRAKENEK